jgi:hypothetical protein
MQKGGFMTVKRFLTVVVLALTLCAPSEALSEEIDSRSDTKKVAISLGYTEVEDANSFTLEVDVTLGHALYGGGLFLIDNGNLPGRLRDYPPPSGVNTVDVGGFRDNETGAYFKYGRVFSGFRVFGMLGLSDVTTKYVVKSTLSDIHYVTEEETDDYYILYGGGIGYLIADKVLLQYQYDNRRKSLIMVGISFKLGAPKGR